MGLWYNSDALTKTGRQSIVCPAIAQLVRGATTNLTDIPSEQKAQGAIVALCKPTGSPPKAGQGVFAPTSGCAIPHNNQGGTAG
ncbi:MAG: hypothetical protein RI985_689 [Chloroflexota bacterium]|jgi:mRNA-degrading endonuclease toxin of MazEF toxin-antitoxin module